MMNRTYDDDVMAAWPTTEPELRIGRVVIIQRHPTANRRLPFSRTFPYLRSLQRFYILLLLGLSWLGFGALPANGQLLTSPLRQALQAELDRVPVIFGVKGIAAAVLLPDGSMFTGASGVSTDTPAVALRPNMLFGVASVTKTFTAAVIMRFAQNGRLSLDDTLGQRLPTWARVPNVDLSLTLRQLLNHTSGLGEYTTSNAFNNAVNNDPAHVFTSQELVQFIPPIRATRGAQYEYNNTNYLLLGIVIEHNLRLPLAAAFRQQLWGTAQMNDTFLGFSDSIPSSYTIAHPWSWDLNGPQDQLLVSQNAILSGFRSAGGALSTVSDLARWGKALFSNSRVLSPAALQEMQTISPQSVAAGRPYALGITPFDFQGIASWGHNGLVYGRLATFSYEPLCGVSIGMVLNDDRVPGLRNSIQERIYNIIRAAICPAVGIPDSIEDLIVSPPVFAPNPTGRTSSLIYFAPKATHLQLTLLDATGRLVCTKVLDPTLREHPLTLDQLPAGIYQAHIQRTTKSGLSLVTKTKLAVLP